MSANIESIEEVKSIFRDVYGTVALPQVHCRDCKFWRQLRDVAGICIHEKLNNDLEQLPDGLCADGNRFCTGPEFGCVHAKPR